MTRPGLNITIDGLMELGADLRRLDRPGLKMAIRESLRGAGGEALATEMRLRAPKRTGGLVSRIKVHDATGSGGDVEVGYKGDGVYPDALGTWIESGTQPHEIKAPRGHYLAIGGGKTYKSVNVSGIKARRVAHYSIKAAEWEVLADITDKINAMIGGVSE